MDRAGRRVLLVEDDASVRGALGAHLVRSGFSVVGVASTAEALRELAEARLTFDVILTDCAMPPGPDGIELAREARLGAFAHPIVLMSGGFPEDAQGRIEEAAVDWVLQKPVSAGQLIDVLHDVMEESRAGCE